MRRRRRRRTSGIAIHDTEAHGSAIMVTRGSTRHGMCPRSRDSHLCVVSRLSSQPDRLRLAFAFLGLRACAVPPSPVCGAPSPCTSCSCDNLASEP